MTADPCDLVYSKQKTEAVLILSLEGHQFPESNAKLHNVT